VVLLHGVGLRAEAWAAQIEALSQRFAVIAPDMAGHGESPRLTGPVGLSAYTDLVAEGLETLGGPCLVAGHSMGAMIALDLAIRHPGLVVGVAALNAIYRRSPEATSAVRARAATLDGETSGDPSGPLIRWFGGAETPEADACRRWLVSVDPKGYRDAYGVFAAEDGPQDQGLCGLACPALFFTGADEPNSTPAMSRAMAALAPRGRVEILPNAAHMMPMTHATQVSRVLGAFFDDAAGAMMQRT
jgi:pimeloyl-ACP methyl ester carboxylesterase